MNEQQKAKELEEIAEDIFGPAIAAAQPFAATLKTWTPPRYRWKVHQVFAMELEGLLNYIQQTGWEIFSVLESKKSPYHYAVISRQPIEENPNDQNLTFWSLVIGHWTF